MSQSIKTIIFDLGRVIVEIDREKTYAALKQFFQINREDTGKFFNREDFALFEIGQLSEEDFFAKLQLSFKTNHDVKVIKSAWNAMIVGVPLAGVQLLQALKQEFDLYALSNTNPTHVKAINSHLFNQHQIDDITQLFHKTYFSYELGISKPDKKIFEHVVTENQLAVANTLFIDDDKDNINAAHELGFQTLHLLEQAGLTQQLSVLLSTRTKR